MDKLLSHLPYILLNVFLVLIMALILVLLWAFFRHIFEQLFMKLKAGTKIMFLPKFIGAVCGIILWAFLIIIVNNFFFPLRPTLLGWTAQKLAKGMEIAGIEMKVEKRPMKWPFGPG